MDKYDVTMNIIEKVQKEYTKDNVGVQCCKITFLGIPVYKSLATTTSENVVKQLTPIQIKKEQTSNNNLKAKMGFQIQG